MSSSRHRFPPYVLACFIVVGAAVLMDVADMDAVMGAMQTEAAAEAMAYDGVLADTLVILVEA